MSPPAGLVAALVRLVSGVRLQEDLPPAPVTRIYFANHSSHLDFVVIWSVLPAELRRRTRPVAAADYWNRGAVRRFFSRRLFRAVLIAREGVNKTNNPLQEMGAALEAGEDLILFPEGTRSADGKLHAFRSGLYHLSRQFPSAELVPVYLENLNRILPKGEFLFVPLLGQTRFGAPISGPGEGEHKTEFLERARQALCALGPGAEQNS